MDPKTSRKYCRRHDVPHWDFRGAMQFITIRQADSLPRNVVRHLLELDSTRARTIKLHQFLDAGYGSCVLARREAYEIVESSLHWLHKKGRLRLDEYVIMPNHVHFSADILVELESVMHSFKSYTSLQIGKLSGVRKQSGTTGRFWRRGYFDRLIRDEEHLYNTRRYIRENPVAAGLVDHPDAWPPW